MKVPPIRFYSSADNSETKPKKESKPKPVDLTGYISSAGKLVFPAKTVEQLGLDPETTSFKIGTQDGKRKIKSLYLIPANDQEADTFTLAKGAKSYTLLLALILQKGGVDYSETKYSFTIKPFDYEDDTTGYELQLTNQMPKQEYTGKARGRKPRATSEAEWMTEYRLA